MSEVGVFTTRDIAIRCGVDVTFVEELVQPGVIAVQPGTDCAFPAEVPLRVGRFVRLQRDLGVNHEGAVVIVDLLDRIEAPEHRLAQLELTRVVGLHSCIIRGHRNRRAARLPFQTGASPRSCSQAPRNEAVHVSSMNHVRRNGSSPYTSHETVLQTRAPAALLRPATAGTRTCVFPLG